MQNTTLDLLTKTEIFENLICILAYWALSPTLVLRLFYMKDSFSSLLALHQHHHDRCPCELKPLATQPVFGYGNPNSDIVFIGEAPGKSEDLEGKPFVGRAGKFLTEILHSAGLNREKIYITNTVKYRPPNNRDPEVAEKKDCLPWLVEELTFVAPKIIVPLGRHAMNTFLPEAKISQAHGNLIKKHVTFTLANKKYEMPNSYYFPLYHPAAALYNGGLRTTLEEDMGKLLKALKLID